MPIYIREETPSDITAIRALTIAAFANAPYSSHTEQFIVDELRKARALFISLVAEEGRMVIGHVAISPVAISDGARNWFGLGPISVAPGHQRRGIGSLLMREGLRTLRERGGAGCVLLGNPNYYSRFGFKYEPGLVLPDVPADYFQALSFESGVPRGTVSYHAAFNATGRSD